MVKTINITIDGNINEIIIAETIKLIKEAIENYIIENDDFIDILNNEKCFIIPDITITE